MYLFEGEAIFEAATPNIIDVTDKNGTTLKVRCRQSIGAKKEYWKGLPAGNYDIQVRVNSGKSREFDYQWLGQTYSNARKIKIPMAEQAVAPNRSLPPSQKSTSPVRGSED